jgi:hypothetical protein
MIKIQGSSFKKVEIPELNDCIHYGQVKTYSESQYSRSPSLAKGIKLGHLALTEGSTPAETPSVAPKQEKPKQEKPKQEKPKQEKPKQEKPKQEKPKQSPSENEKLLEKQILELKQQLSDSKEEKPDGALKGMMEEMKSELMGKFSDLSARVEELPAQATETATPSGGTEIALQQISRKLDSMQFSGPGIRQNNDAAKIKEEVYIPDIAVTDMSNHISLQSKDMGSGGQVNESLAALRKLRKSR